MGENWLYIKYFKVALAGAFKFVAGIFAGLTGPLEKRLSIWETVLFSTIGMMITVIIISIIGEAILNRRIEKQKSKPSDPTLKINWKKRLITKIKSRWGLFGISFLTPVLFSPIGGALLAISIGAPRHKIFLYMLISAIFWGFSLSLMADELVTFFELIFDKNNAS